MKATYQKIDFTDNDIVNLDDWIAHGENNPNNVRPFLLHDHGYTVAVVFADNLQEALDIAADADVLDGFAIQEGEMDQYPEGEGVSYLGNAGEPFDIENLGVLELPNPPRSFVAQFNAQ